MKEETPMKTDCTKKLDLCGKKIPSAAPRLDSADEKQFGIIRKLLF
jgi:hypothetical protein